MEIIIQPTAAEATLTAACLIRKLLCDKPDAVLGLATGSTPLPLYRALIAMKLDWSCVTTFNLDEYVGLLPAHEQSYHHFMWEHLFQHVNIAKERVHIPNGVAADVPRECSRYEAKIRSVGGIDLQVLGIGTDGHIGFNEPSSSLASRTRIKTLTRETRRDNARFFGSEAAVPVHCITMGLGTIMEARRCVLLAFGEHKAPIIAQTIEGPLAANNPASILQMHPAASFFIDESAAKALTHGDYYRHVFEKKPQWQKGE